MKVLVINVGSTSVKYNLYEMDTEATLARGAVERVGSPESLHKWEAGGSKGRRIARSTWASRQALSRLATSRGRNDLLLCS